MCVCVCVCVCVYRSCVELTGEGSCVEAGVSSGAVQRRQANVVVVQVDVAAALGADHASQAECKLQMDAADSAD